MIILGGALGGRKSAKSSKSFGMMVARDGFAQHYTPFGIPTAGIFLNPRTELSV